jgi:hypothetical protein
MRTKRTIAVGLAADSAESPLTGDGWNLTLKPGWKLAPGERKGSYRLVKEP